MYQINNEKFGHFLAEVRKEKQMTQKDLADKLFVSDKTVSKWERGNSMPNVTLLIPIADVLGITVTELLQGEKLKENKTLNSDVVETLVVNSLDLSLRDTIRQRKKNWIFAFLISIGVVVIEAILLTVSGISIEQMGDSLYISLLMLLFASWLCIFAKELLLQAACACWKKNYPRHIMIQIKLILYHKEFSEYTWQGYLLIMQTGDMY